MPEPEPLEQSRPTAATEQPNQAIPQSSPSAKASPSAIELLQEAWQTEPVIPASPKPAGAMPMPPAESVAPKPPAASAAAMDAPTPPPAVPLAEPAPPASAPPPAAAAVPPAAAPTPATVEVVKPRPRPVKPKRVPKPEAPDDWKKGIGIFGGG
jgi:hypothetical protein